MKETGRLLREAREAQNISLAAVSAVTKINIKVLEAIENAQMENLPSKTFLRGFVQTYASFLKLSPSDILEQFSREMGTTRYNPAVAPGPDGQPPVENGAAATVDTQNEVIKAPTPLAPVKHTTDDEGLAFANGGRSMTSKIVFAGIAAILIVGIYVVSEIVQKYQKESQVAEPPPEVQSSALPEPVKPVEPPKELGPTPITAETKPVEKPKAETKTESKPEAVKTETKPSEPAKIVESKPPEPKPPEPKPAAPNQTPAPTPVIEAKPPPPPPKPLEKPTETAATTPTTSEPPKPPPPPSNPQEVVVEALDAVKVDYRIDGGQLQTVTLQPEEKRSFKAKREVKMDVSDGGAVSVNHNGKDKGVPGNLGQPMKLSFP